MLSGIEDAIINILQESVEDVPKNNIGMRKPDLNIEENLPAISVANIDFKVEEVGIGRSFTAKNNEVREYFSGDGEKVNFVLTKKPLKPTLIVEYPPGERRLENTDYIIDYGSGSVNFQSPPEKGSNNVLIRYLAPAEIKSVKLIMKYHIYVWSKDESQRDKITFDIIKTLLRGEEEFDLKGIIIKPTGGFNIPANEVPKEVYGKTIECSVETYLQVETLLPRIEKIEMSGK
ncbi:hypothetical protein KEJ34_02685 [Candidatus Bathyarchaeota archaeon]|nr:hypothetical protein [Candidatus Bathyarchaeota archaeon]